VDSILCPLGRCLRRPFLPVPGGGFCIQGECAGRAHKTLTTAAGGIKRTPAMAAGVADHVWKLEEVVALL
jgi:hypothetical protein